HASCPLYPPKADMCGATRDVRFGPKADMEPFHLRVLICSLSVQDVIGRQRTANALECKIAHWFNRYVLLDGHQHTRANQDLPRLGFVAKPRCNVGYCSDSGVIKSAFKADRAECGKSVRNSNAEPNLMPKFTPLLDQRSYGRSHVNRH